jgi:phage-related minor tail protein
MAVRVAILGPIADFFGGLITVPGLQAGGSFSKSAPILVGEAGPEILMPSTSGRIIDNAHSREMLSGGGGDVVFTGDFNVNVPPGAAQSPQDAARIGQEVARQIKAQIIETMRETTRPGGLFYQGRVT